MLPTGRKERTVRPLITRELHQRGEDSKSSAWTENAIIVIAFIIGAVSSE